MAKNKKKVPGIDLHRSEGKVPRVDSSLQTRSTFNPSWHIGSIDLAGPWGWNVIESDLFFKQILPKIQHFESMTWSEILNKNNHEVEVEQISKEAKKRLLELKLDDFDRIVSLRLNGVQRIWGLKIQNVFKILWWDPNHEVYPSTLKHT